MALKMPHWKHLHLLVIRDSTLTEVDVPATLLALSSRGRDVHTGCNRTRDELAALLGDGLLAELLLSGRPMVADSIVNAYVFIEL